MAFCATLFLFALTLACSALPDLKALSVTTNSATLHRTAGVGEEKLTHLSDAVPPASQSPQGNGTGAIQTPLVLDETLGAGPLIGGNQTELLVDGEATLAAMMRTIASARNHINLETYIILDDRVGRRFSGLLRKKRAEGVTVNLIYDAFGSRDTPRKFFDRLKAAGINVVEFNPVTLGSFGPDGPFRRRTHRKLLIVDGTTAFVGGINIGEIFMKKRRLTEPSPDETEYWRDTHVMIKGPAVSQFQKLFLETWKEKNGPQPASPVEYFPPLSPVGKQMVQTVSNKPGYDRRTAYMAYICALARAEKSIHLTQSYFLPDDQTLRALSDAAKRGVDVQVILPARTDHFMVRVASRKYYASLLASGVKIYERDGTILHAKTAVVDGIWSTVGSMNLEMWSLVNNDEVNAVIVDPEFGAKMEDLFDLDRSDSTPITEDRWNERSLPERLVHFFFGLFSYWL
jgi:cardiolipin synthase A/B